MDTEEGLKALANSVIDSYELRVATVKSLMTQANNFLQDFRIELEEMILELQGNLARSESLRKKDFNLMISDILERHVAIEYEAKQNLDSFQNEEDEMVRRLRNIVTRGTGSNVDDMTAIRNDILQRQKERERHIIKLLKRFHVEQEELKTGIKKLLSKGKTIKTKDFKATLTALRTHQNDHDENLSALLDDFDNVRAKVNNQWQTVSSISQ